MLSLSIVTSLRVQWPQIITQGLLPSAVAKCFCGIIYYNHGYALLELSHYVDVAAHVKEDATPIDRLFRGIPPTAQLVYHCEEDGKHSRTAEVELESFCRSNE